MKKELIRKIVEELKKSIPSLTDDRPELLGGSNGFPLSKSPMVKKPL